MLLLVMKKCLKNGPNFGHLKNDQILSNFLTPKKMSKVFTGVEFGNELLDPSRTKIKKCVQSLKTVPLRWVFPDPKKKGVAKELPKTFFERFPHSSVSLQKDL